MREREREKKVTGDRTRTIAFSLVGPKVGFFLS